MKNYLECIEFISVTLGMLGNVPHVCHLRLLTFSSQLTFLFYFFLSRTLSDCLTVWIQNRTDFKSVLLWVQTVSKGHQTTKKFVGSRQRVNYKTELFAQLHSSWLSQGL